MICGIERKKEIIQMVLSDGYDSSTYAAFPPGFCVLCSRILTKFVWLHQVHAANLQSKLSAYIMSVKWLVFLAGIFQVSGVVPNMFFFHRDSTPKNQDRPVNTVKLYLGDYYRDYGGQYSGGKNLLCVMPYYEDSDPSFGNLARSLGAQLLSSFPFVVENLLGAQFRHSQRKGFFHKSYLEPADLLQEAYISEYQRQGGQVHYREKNDLTALSEFDGPKLLPLIPIDSLANAVYCGYGAREMPPGWTAGRPELREEAQYELCLVCGEYHDHLLIETSGDPQHYIDLIRERCRQEGRMLILETWGEGTGQGRLQEQQLL